nr:uncharacterized protein LOC127321137 [Lolium perenne]
MTQSKIIFDVSVEVMAQQRIMRQFGSRQLVDPPPPIAPLPAYVHKYNRKGTNHSSTWWLQRVGSYVAEWDGATTHVWPNDEQFDPQEFDAYLQRYTGATRVRLIPPTDPAEAPPASMHDMYPTQSTAGSRQHAGQMTSYLQDEVARYTRQVSSEPLTLTTSFPPRRHSLHLLTALLFFTGNHRHIHELPLELGLLAWVCSPAASSTSGGTPTSPPTFPTTSSTSTCSDAFVAKLLPRARDGNTSAVMDLQPSFNDLSSTLKPAPPLAGLDSSRERSFSSCLPGRLPA